MKEAIKELEEIEKWLNSLGQGWNYFGHVDRAKQRLKNAITLIKNAVQHVLGTVWRLISTKLRPKHRGSIYFLCGGKN